MIRSALCIAITCLTVLTNSGRTQEDKKGPLRMKIYTIRDVPRNNSQPLSTVLMPADWHAESEMKWTLASATVPFAARARFSAPDGTAAVEFFAIPQGALNTSPLGSQGYAPQDVIAALGQLAQSSRPKARLELLEKKAGVVEKTGGEQGAVAQSANSAQAGRIRVSYEENGRTFEEEFAGTLHLHSTALGQGYETRQWFLEFPRSIKAVKGKLNELLPVGQAVCRSARPTPEFLKALQVAAQVVATIRRQDMDLTQLEGQMWLNANRQLNDAWRQVADLKVKELLERRHARLDSYGRFTDTKADSAKR